MIDARTTGFFRFFASAYPARTAGMVAFLGLAGLLEGFGVATLIPVLGLAQGGGAADDPLAVWITRGLELVGLTPALPVLLAVVFGSVLLKSVVYWYAMVQVSRTVVRVVRDLRMKLLRALMVARWPFFVTQRGGAWANAIGLEAYQAGAAYAEACQILAAIFPIAAYIVIAALMSWQTSLFAVICGAVTYLALRIFITRSRLAAQDAAVESRAMTGMTADVIQGLKPLKAMASERRVLDLLRERIDAVAGASLRLHLSRWGLNFFHEPIVALVLGVAIFIVFSFTSLTLSSVVVLAFTFYRILTHLNTVQVRYQAMMSGEATFWSLMERVEAAEQDREEVERGASVEGLANGIEFENVWFAYGSEPVLRGLSLRIAPGSFVSISGESGSGKTTLVDLLSGLLAPTEGRILVDGRDLKEIAPRAWRSRIGYVPQEMLLLNDTIRMNISLGDPDVTDEDIERALRLAGAWDFVFTERGGLGSEIGDRGSMLSGGQRQRLALARALAREPSLLILDEVTTALDPVTEAAICDTLASLAGSVTIIAISHQPAIHRVSSESFIMRKGCLEPFETPVATQG